MKKIVLIANCSDRENQIFSLAKALFPECEVSVVSANSDSHGRKIPEHFNRETFEHHENDRVPVKIVCRSPR